MSEEVSKHSGKPLSEDELKDFQATWKEIEETSANLETVRIDD